MGWLSDLGHSIDDSFHSAGSAFDNALHGDLSDAGDFLGQSVADFQPVFDPAGDVGDYIGDIGQMGGFHGEDILKKVKNNPARLAFGIDPLGTKIGNKVFNKDWDPGTTTLGGPTTKQYQSAENSGIDTANARGLNTVANMIASFYGGQGISGAFGGGAAGGLAAGGALGAGGALDNGTSIGKGFFQGAAGGGLANGINYAGTVGITDPAYQRLINGGIGGSINAGFRGENIGQGAALGAGGSYLKGQFKNMNQESLYPEGGQNYAPYNPQADWLGQSMGQSIPSSVSGGMPMQQTTPDWVGAVGSTSVPRPLPRQNFLSQLEQNPWFRGLGGLMGGTNPDVGKGLDAAGMAPNKFDTVGRLLGSLYTQNRARRDAQEQMNRMDVLRGAYRTDMGNQLARRDAASGRRSQYGPREVELMARLAQLDHGNATQLNQLYNQRRAANVGALNDVFTGVRRLGGPQQIYNDISSYFGQ